LCSTAQTLSYGPNALPLAMLGDFSYAGGIPALVMGFFYFRRDFRGLDRVLITCAVLIAVMLVGVPLEYLGFRFSLPVLGLINAREDWLRWFDNGTTSGFVRMISGFHRSPEVMGWQAAVMVIIALFQITRRPRWLPVWLGLAAWGVVCVLLSGRRKMLIMIFVFVIAYVLMSKGWYRQWLLVVLLIACFLLVPLLGFFVQDDYLRAADSSRNTSGERLRHQLVDGPLFLLDRVGLFGYGVGTRTQGSQHIDMELHVPLMEGGFEKVLVELGLFGTLAFLFLAVVLARCAWRCYSKTRLPTADKVALGGLIAFLAGNLAAFAVAFQIFGDPLVLTLVGFSAGFLLSAPRLELEQRAVRPPAQAVPDAAARPTMAEGTSRPLPRLEAR
jgi:O-antigen ligase